MLSRAHRNKGGRGTYSYSPSTHGQSFNNELTVSEGHASRFTGSAAILFGPFCELDASWRCPIHKALNTASLMPRGANQGNGRPAMRHDIIMRCIDHFLLSFEVQFLKGHPVSKSPSQVRHCIIFPTTRSIAQHHDESSQFRSPSRMLSFQRSKPHFEI